MKFIVIIFSMLVSTSAYAGAANAGLDCKSADGLTVTGNVPGHMAEFEITIQQGEKSAKMFSSMNHKTGEVQENAVIHVVQALHNKVWTLFSELKVEHSYGFLEMYALPDTVVYKQLKNGYEAKFAAKLEVNLQEIGDETVEKTVNCTLKLEL